MQTETMLADTFNIEKVRQDFPNLKVQIRGKPLVYLDNAATTLKPQSVINTIQHHYSSETSNVHRAVHYLSERATLAYEQSRRSVQKFLNAPEESQIIFTRGTSEGINIVAQSFGRTFLKEGDEILISEMEHHSNIVPWQMLAEEKKCALKVIPMNDNGELMYEEFENLLTSKTKIVSIVYVSNSLGTINPVKKIIEAAHQLNVPVLVDGAQAVSYTKIDVQDLNCDFFVFSAHKLFGPTGVGILYGKKELLEQMPPVQGGGDMIETVTFEKTTYAPLPQKFEAGTPNIAGVIGMGAAIEYLNTIDFGAMAEYKNVLLKYATGALKDIEGLKLIGTAHHKTAVLSFVLPGVHAHDLGTLVDQEGVAVRTGHHCTMPVMQHFNINATSRASLAMYNTKDEIDTLVNAIRKAQKVFG